MARLLPNSELIEIDGRDGHDAFLIEVEEINRRLVEFIARHGLKPRLEPAVGE
jgi:homoserine acetyltransferase